MCLPKQLHSTGKKWSNCSNIVAVFPVPTVFDKTERKLNTREISSPEKLAALKAKDAFMYYSISSIRRAHMKGNQGDVSLLRVPSSLNDLNSNHEEVTRKSRVSFECYPDLFVEDTPAQAMESAGTSGAFDDEEEDWVEQLVSLRAKRRRTD